MAQHKIELGAHVYDAEKGQLTPGQYWHLENVSGKLAEAGDDTLNYRIVFNDPGGWPLDSTLIIKVWPLAADRRRRNARPEAGFMVQPASDDFKGNAGASFRATPAYSLVLTENMTRIRAIYLGIEDCNYEPTGAPLWHLAVNTSAVLGLLPCLKGRWTPLAPVHPDPSVDLRVPIQLQPQGSVRWSRYRETCSNYALFKGKISASVLYKFIGGGFRANSFFEDRDSGFKGNHLTRHGSATECKIVLAHLLRFTQYTAEETGSWQHPAIGDACGAPDALLWDAQRCFTSFPPWWRDLWMQDPDVLMDRNGGIDKMELRRGVFEAKAMKNKDKHGKGPGIKPEHICQVYWNMICTGTYWGELVRTCDELGQGRVFRIYRRPDTAKRLEACVRRMHSEMVAGTPYLTAVRSEQNEELVKDFRRQASYFNEVPTPGTNELQHYYDLTWPVPEAAELDRIVAAYDICHEDVIEAVAAPEPSSKKAKKKAAEEATAVSLFPALGIDAAYMSDGRYLEAYEETNKVLGKALRNGDYDEPLEKKVFELQVVRLMNMKARAHAAMALQGAQEHKE